VELIPQLVGAPTAQKVELQVVGEDTNNGKRVDERMRKGKKLE